VLEGEKKVSLRVVDVKLRLCDGPVSTLDAPFMVVTVELDVPTDEVLVSPPI
jgi:hypothetical protein